MWKRKLNPQPSQRQNRQRLSKPALTALLAALTVAILPHVLRLPLWLSALFVLAAGWRWRAAGALSGAPARRFAQLPNTWLRLALTLAAIAGLLLTFGTLLGRDAGIGLLAAMAAMKLLEARTPRDGLVLVFLGYFLLISGLLYGQTVFHAVYLLLAVTVLLNAQLLIQPQHAGLRPLAGLRFSGKLLAQALPLMVILFILFPRIPGPLWGLPKDAYSGLTGLSNSMTPGSIAELIQSDEVAFRVRFDNGEAPSADKMYWRGPVLWWLRDRTWRGQEESLLHTLPYQPLSNPVDYSVVLEPHGQHWLFALDLPGQIPSVADGITGSYQLKRARPVVDRLQYGLRSYTNYRSAPLSDNDRRRFLQLPPRGNERTKALAQQWRARFGDPSAIIDQALALFRQQPFFYTLTPPLLGRDNIDEFLFDSRRGFCEHYAGSFVYLMRAADIPARVVTGYQGGERNGDYYIIRQSDAHAWAEVWLPQQGWVRVDPTAAVAPERIERGLFAAVDNPNDLPLLARGDGSLLRQLALSWDTLNNAWNEAVLAYSSERQREFLSGLGFGQVAWREMMLSLVASLSLIGLAVGGWQAWRRYQRSLTAHDPLGRSYQQFCARLARHDSRLARQPSEGPLAYVERVAQTRPELAKPALAIGQLYARQRYGGDGSSGASELQRLLKLLRQALNQHQRRG